jgi:hypothetical protein
VARSHGRADGAIRQAVIALACAGLALTTGWGGLSHPAVTFASDPHVILDGGICGDTPSDSGLLPGYTKYANPWVWLRSFDSFVLVGISDDTNTTPVYKWTDEAGQACYQGALPYAGLGVHTVSVQQYSAGDPADPSTLVADGAPWTLTVNVGQSPVAAVAAPTLTSDTGVPGDDITNVAASVYTGTALGVPAVKTYIDGGTWLTVVPDVTTGLYTFTLPAQADGLHAVGVQAEDDWGNTSTMTTRSLTVDTQAPVTSAPVLAPSSDTGVVGDDITKAGLNVTTGTSEPGALVYIEAGGEVLMTTVANSDGTWSATGMAPEGTFTVTARGTDVAGNVGDPGPSLTITFDSTPPGAATVGLDAVSVRRPGVAGTATFSIVGTAPGASEVDVVVDGTGQTHHVTVASGAWSLQLGPLADGTHKVVATAIDVAGNSAAPTTFNFAVDTSPLATATIAPATFVPTPPSTATWGVSDRGPRGDLGLPLLLLVSVSVVFLAIWRRKPATR